MTELNSSRVTQTAAGRFSHIEHLQSTWCSCSWPKEEKRGAVDDETAVAAAAAAAHVIWREEARHGFVSSG